jgi:hypothetical protein
MFQHQIKLEPNICRNIKAFRQKDKVISECFWWRCTTASLNFLDIIHCLGFLYKYKTCFRNWMLPSSHVPECGVQWLRLPLWQNPLTSFWPFDVKRSTFRNNVFYIENQDNGYIQESETYTHELYQTCRRLLKYAKKVSEPIKAKNHWARKWKSNCIIFHQHWC